MKKKVSGFDIEPLHDMVAVGAVHARGARLWARAPGAERVVVEITPATALPSESPARAEVAVSVDPDADHTVAFNVPEDAPGLDPLAPDRRYNFRVLRADGSLVGAGRFRTAPDRTPSSFSFAIASCHQPFAANGHLLDESVRMLSSVERALEARDVRFLLLVGDQIYADYPPSRSLFGRFFHEVAPPGRSSVLDCTRDEVRRLYHLRHRIFFGVEEFRRLQACFPTYPMLDDHDIRDNFGSAPEHQQKEWEALRSGARDAFYDYQASRVTAREGTESSFHYGFVNGPVGVFVMDLRSERRTTGDAVQVYSTRQHADLQRFLATHADLPLITVVVTIPVAYLEAWVTNLAMKVTGEGSNAADRWSNPKALADRNRLLRALRDHSLAHPKQRLVLVGGDIHVGSLLRIEWDDGAPTMYQFTSSAISNVRSRVAQIAAERVAKAVHGMFGGADLSASVSLVPGEGRNPYGGLNVGVVEVTTGDTTAVRFRLLGAPDDAGNSRLVFDSGPL